MPLDFGIYPPEINSARMYTGPGAGPMLAAMQAWDTMADELYTAGAGYQSVLSDLAQAWAGPSAAAMTAAAERSIEWLNTAAAHAEHTAAQAGLAVSAFEAAFASTVPPPEIAANRSLLAVLVATNLLGQNTPAIAATEALYAQMWAQDALAMYTYAAASAAAAVLTPFGSPQTTTDPGAAARQAAAASRSIAGDTQAAISAAPQALSALAAPAQITPLTTLANLADLFINAPVDFTAIALLTPTDLVSFADFPPSLFNTLSGLVDDDTFSGWDGQKAWPESGPAPVQPFKATLPHPPAGVPSTSPMSAAAGQANTVGKLSVPPGWATAAPQEEEVTPSAAEVRTAAFTTPLAGTSNAASAPLQVGAAMAGQGLAGPPPSGPAQGNAEPVTPARRPTPPGAPAEDTSHAPAAPRPVVTGVVAAIRDIARQRAAGQLSDAEYRERKHQLLERSFRHPDVCSCGSAACPAAAPPAAVSALSPDRR